jgi:hypothetical protein
VIATPLRVPAAEIASSVSERELLRLLGMPRGRALEGDLLDRACGARDWYAQHGGPFVASRRVAIGARGSSLRGPGASETDGSRTDVVRLEEGTELRSALLTTRLEAGQAHALVALAASAGLDVASEVKRLWAEERPDEAYFLDRFRAAAPLGETLLPHLSPGCGHWDLADQHRVMGVLTGEKGHLGTDETVRLGPIELLPSGALHPQHSVLAVLGVTHRKGTTTPEDLCRACDLDPCAFRRAPFAAPTPKARETP